jgi:hypothetical protein
MKRAIKWCSRNAIVRAAPRSTLNLYVKLLAGILPITDCRRRIVETPNLKALVMLRNYLGVIFGGS